MDSGRKWKDSEKKMFYSSGKKISAQSGIFHTRLAEWGPGGSLLIIFFKCLVLKWSTCSETWSKQIQYFFQFLFWRLPLVIFNILCWGEEYENHHKSMKYYLKFWIWKSWKVACWPSTAEGDVRKLANMFMTDQHVPHQPNGPWPLL